MADLFRDYGFKVSDPSEVIGTLSWTYTEGGMRLQLRPSTKGLAVRGVLQRFDEGYAVSKPTSVRVGRLVWDRVLGMWFSDEPS